MGLRLGPLSAALPQPALYGRSRETDAEASISCEPGIDSGAGSEALNVRGQRGSVLPQMAGKEWRAGVNSEVKR
jgi:hypothetical protein